MKKILMISSLLMLMACASKPALPPPVANPKFPSAPDKLMVPCDPFEQIKPTVLMTDVMSTVVTNYGIGNKCANKVDDWISWYTQQKAIYEKVK
jgi:hypothetical protein